MHKFNPRSITLYNRIRYIAEYSRADVNGRDPVFPRVGTGCIRSARVASTRTRRLVTATDAKRNGNRGSFARALEEIQKSNGIFFLLRCIHRQRDALSINRNEMKLYRYDGERERERVEQRSKENSFVFFQAFITREE